MLMATAAVYSKMTQKGKAGFSLTQRFKSSAVLQPSSMEELLFPRRVVPALEPRPGLSIFVTTSAHVYRSCWAPAHRPGQQ